MATIQSFSVLSPSNINLYTQLERQPCLVPCEKVKAGEIIKLLGLQNLSHGKTRPKFQSDVVKEFYASTQKVVDKDTQAQPRFHYLKQIRDPESDLFAREAKGLLDKYGSQIYGQDRSHVMAARMDHQGRPIDPLYPSDLYCDNPKDFNRILLYIRCWLANRALRKVYSRDSRTIPRSSLSQLELSSSLSVQPIDTSGADSAHKDAPVREQTSCIPSADMETSNRNVTAQKRPPRSASSTSRKRSRAESRSDEHNEDIRTFDGNAVQHLEYRSGAREISSDLDEEDKEESRTINLVTLHINGQKLRRFDHDVSCKSSSAPTSTSPKPPALGVHISTEQASVLPASEQSEDIRPCSSPESELENQHESREVCTSPGRSSHDEPTANSPTRMASPQSTNQCLSPVEQQPAQCYQDGLSNMEIIFSHAPEASESKQRRRKTLAALISIFASDAPSSDVIQLLGPLKNDFMGKNETAQDNERGEMDIGSASIRCWLQMHIQLEAFRLATNYYGGYGEELDNHFRCLKPGSAEKTAAMKAWNELGMWQYDASQDGSWIACPLLNNGLASFFVGIIPSYPGQSLEDLVNLFAAYNERLSRWFL